MRGAAVLLAGLVLVAGLAAAQDPGRKAAPAPAAGAKSNRIALVIGNAAYKDAPLANTINDAQDVAKALEVAGFRVIRRENASLRDMQLALREFGDALGRTSTGLFYYAGHGVQVRGRNYLVPADADIAREDEVAFSALDLAAVLEKLDTARNPLNLVILDACRNNPFATRFQLAAPGLAQIDAPPGTLIAFSTAPGSVASDGSGRNGLYTQYLLREMARPGVAVEEVFKGVRAAVRKESGGKQVPWESTSLETGFVFVAAPKVAEVPKPATGGPKAASARGAVAVQAPPAFALGDTWTYRIRNLIANTERVVTARVKEIRPEDVLFDNGNVLDHLGNFTRFVTGDRVTRYTPSGQTFAFPLRKGANWSLTFLQEFDGRTFDNEVTIVMGEEEEVTVPAGRMRAVKLMRTTKWKERGKDNAGTHTMTYWYNGGVKRPVLVEIRNVTASGRLLLHERQEMERFEVH